MFSFKNVEKDDIWLSEITFVTHFAFLRLWFFSFGYEVDLKYFRALVQDLYTFFFNIYIFKIFAAGYANLIKEFL